MSGLNKWQASTLGLATVYQWLQGSLQLHQRAMREVTARQPPHVPDECCVSLANVPPGPLCQPAAHRLLHCRVPQCKLSEPPAWAKLIQRQCSACLQVLSSATPDELNFMLLNTSCPALVEVADGAIMQLLTSPRHRLYELSVVTRWRTGSSCSAWHAGIMLQATSC